MRKLRHGEIKEEHVSYLEFFYINIVKSKGQFQFHLYIQKKIRS